MQPVSDVHAHGEARLGAVVRDEEAPLALAAFTSHRVAKLQSCKATKSTQLQSYKVVSYKRRSPLRPELEDLTERDLAERAAL